jgi:hypothetical protein
VVACSVDDVLERRVRRRGFEHVIAVDQLGLIDVVVPVGQEGAVADVGRQCGGEVGALDVACELEGRFVASNGHGLRIHPMVGQDIEIDGLRRRCRP